MREGTAGGASGSGAGDGGRAPSGTGLRTRSSGGPVGVEHASPAREGRSDRPAPAASSGAFPRTGRRRATGRRTEDGPPADARVLSIRLLASEKDIEETLALAVAAHEESHHRRHRFDPERRRRMLAARFLADPGRYGYLIARRGGQALGMLTCHAQQPYYSDAVVVSCLSFYVPASCRRTLLGGRVAMGLLDAGRRWALNRRAVEWHLHVTNGLHVGRTDRMLRRLGFLQTGGNYAMTLPVTPER